MDKLNNQAGAFTANNAYTPNMYSNYCGFRLPCGYCTQLGRECPMRNTVTITNLSSDVSNSIVKQQDITLGPTGATSQSGGRVI